jgi:hypothetical protein
VRAKDGAVLPAELVADGLLLLPSLARRRGQRLVQPAQFLRQGVAADEPLRNAERLGVQH